MNELQDTLEEIMEIFKCQDNMLDILEDQQHQLEQLKSVNLKQQELLEKLNALRTGGSQPKTESDHTESEISNTEADNCRNYAKAKRESEGS